MDSQRNLLIITLILLSFIIWQTWEQEKDSNLYQRDRQSIKDIPSNIANHSIISNSQKKYLTVKTDVLELTINVYGGDIEQALLLKYPKSLDSKEPFQLLATKPEIIYQAQSGLVGHNGPDNPINGKRPLYKVEKYNFTLDDNKNEISIPMNYTDDIGNKFIKTLIMKRNEYTVTIRYDIQNKGKEPIEISTFSQLKHSINLSSNSDSGNFTLHTFHGAAYSTSDFKYKKYNFDNIADDENLNITSKGGWIAILQQHFVTAWIPDRDSTNILYTANIGNGIAAIGYRSQPILINPDQSITLANTLWIGPKIQDKMAATAPYLDLTVDYGWLWFISQPLFKLLKLIHSFLGNWGFSIIIITFIVRGITYPLTRAQYISMAKIRVLQPKIQSIRERFSNDKHRQSQEIIALYKAEKVNPLGGCFPLLIQMPIFLALYYMLIGSVELRHAPFILWIHDLSSQDPYYILPIMMGVTMLLIQRISPTTIGDPMQQKIMHFMPIIFTIFFLWFPSGLVLYYIVSNIVTIIQQEIIYRELEIIGLNR